MQAVVVKKSQKLAGNITTEHVEVVDNVDDCHYIMEVLFYLLQVISAVLALTSTRTLKRVSKSQPSNHTPQTLTHDWKA